MPKTSIQRRLIAVVVISQLVLAAGLVGVAVYFTRRQLRNAFDAQLRGRAMSIAALVRYSEDPHPKLIFEDDLVPPPLEREHPDLYQVIANGDQVIARSAELAAAACAHAEERPAAHQLSARRRALSRGAAGESAGAGPRDRRASHRPAHRHLCRAHQPDDASRRLRGNVHRGGQHISFARSR